MLRSSRRPARRRPALGRLVVGVAAALGAAPRFAAAQEAFTPRHVAKLRSVSAARIAPSGKLVAYLLSVPREPGKEDDGAPWDELHVVDTDGHSRPYVTGKVDIGAIDWTPDGGGVSFLAKRGDDKQRSLYVIPIDGGEARRLLKHDTAISAYEWNPDGQRVAFLAKEKQPKDLKKLKDKGFKQEIYEEDDEPTRVWIAQVGEDAPKPKPLELSGSASRLCWSPDGRRLVVALAPSPRVDDEYMATALHVIDVESGATVATIDPPGKVGAFELSPDGANLAVLAGEDIHDPSEGRLTVTPAAGGETTDLAPKFLGQFEAFLWRDARALFYIASEGLHTTFGVATLGSNARQTLVLPGEPILRSFTVADDRSGIAFLADSADHPPEVFYMHAGSEPRRLTDSNPWLKDVRLARQEGVEYTARDGLKLEGVLIRPLDEQPGQRYPLILVVHGGPEAHLSNAWLTRYSYPGQVAAARGFAVFYPNYRGSTGRGVEFSKLGQHDYGGKEFDDLVDAIDHLVNSGLVDRAKVGVTGGSYGGFASAWCATKLTEHFAASVMHVGISDQISKFGTTDIPNEMYLVHGRAWPWEDWDWFRERSPIYYAQQSRTPILILHGKDDTRVHPSQSIELYRYLKTLGKTVRLVLYPGEGHGNRKAAPRYDYNLRLMRWMEHYLKGPGGPPPPYELEYGVSAEDADADKGTDEETQEESD